MPTALDGLLPRLERITLWRAAVVVTLLGAVARALYFPVPTITGSDCDATAYLELARHLRAGHGFVTNTLYFLWERPAAFPRPESLWNPLQPYAIAALGRVVPDLWTAAKLVALLFGLAVPALTLLAAERFTGRRSVACIAGVLAALDTTLVTWSARPLTEMGTVALVTLCWVLAFRRGRFAGLTLGFAVGLAVLQKYQSGLLWVGLVPALVADRGWRDGTRTLAAAALGFALVMAPWWFRNLSVFGDPFYSDIRWNLLCDWGLGGDEQHFWTRLDRPPTLPAYALAHPLQALKVTYGGLRLIAALGWIEHVPSAALVPLAALGAWSLRRRPARPLAFALYVVVLTLGSALTIARPRFLLSALPAVLGLVAAGLVWWVQWGRERGPGLARASTLGALVLLLLVLVGDARGILRLAADRSSGWNPSYYVCALEERAGAAWLRAHAPDRSPAIVVEPLHGAWFLEDRPALRMPFAEAGVDTLRRALGARWLVTTQRDQQERLPGWAVSPPAWAHRVVETGPGAYAPDAVAAGYRHASSVLVYRLDPP
jgi:hypothetical protein